jgi:hypothetical protein
LEWAADEKTLGYTALLDVVHAAPTAELEPITSNYTQTDEGTLRLRVRVRSFYQ